MEKPEDKTVSMVLPEQFDIEPPKPPEPAPQKVNIGFTRAMEGCADPHRTKHYRSDAERRKRRRLQKEGRKASRRHK